MITAEEIGRMPVGKIVMHGAFMLLYGLAKLGNRGSITDDEEILPDVGWRLMRECVVPHLGEVTLDGWPVAEAYLLEDARGWYAFADLFGHRVNFQWSVPHVVRGGRTYPIVPADLAPFLPIDRDD